MQNLEYSMPGHKEGEKIKKETAAPLFTACGREGDRVAGRGEST